MGARRWRLTPSAVVIQSVKDAGRRGRRAGKPRHESSELEPGCECVPAVSARVCEACPPEREEHPSAGLLGEKQKGLHVRLCNGVPYHSEVPDLAHNH
eukprot:scaffold8511_cov57-Phaeocystis_antarctica.AAC.2